MLRNSLSAISLALLVILVSFTGCMGDSDSDSDDTPVVEDTTTNDQTETGSTTDETQDDTTEEPPEVYDGPLKILALHGGGDTPEGLENQPGMQDLMADLPEFEFFFADAPDDDSLCDQCWYADPPGGSAYQHWSHKLSSSGASAKKNSNSGKSAINACIPG